MIPWPSLRGSRLSQVFAYDLIKSTPWRQPPLKAGHHETESTHSPRVRAAGCQDPRADFTLLQYITFRLTLRIPCGVLRPAATIVWEFLQVVSPKVVAVRLHLSSYLGFVRSWPRALFISLDSSIIGAGWQTDCRISDAMARGRWRLLLMRGRIEPKVVQ